jgi:hypothetical protein
MITTLRDTFTQNCRGTSFYSIYGNKVTVDFDMAGEKRVLDNFVTRP